VTLKRFAEFILESNITFDDSAYTVTLSRFEAITEFLPEDIQDAGILGEGDASDVDGGPLSHLNPAFQPNSDEYACFVVGVNAKGCSIVTVADNYQADVADAIKNKRSGWEDLVVEILHATEPFEDREEIEQCAKLYEENGVYLGPLNDATVYGRVV